MVGFVPAAAIRKHVEWHPFSTLGRVANGACGRAEVHAQRSCCCCASRPPTTHAMCAATEVLCLSLPPSALSHRVLCEEVRSHFFHTQSSHTQAESERERSIARVRVRRHFIPPRQLKHGDGCKGGGDRVDGVRQSSAHPNRAQCNQWQSRSRG